MKSLRDYPSIQVALADKTFTKGLAQTRKAALRALATAIGEMLLAHNATHAAFAILFARIVGSHVLAFELWHTQRTDKAQRDLLLAAMRANLRPKSPECKAIGWAVKRVDNLAEFRNDVAHTDTGVDVWGGRPYMVGFNPLATLPSRRERLMQEVQLTASIRSAARDLWRLDAYLWKVWTRLCDGKQTPLPKRPRQQFLRAKGLADALYRQTLL